MAEGKARKRSPEGRRKRKARDDLPPSSLPTAMAPRIKTKYGTFDLDDPVLPAWVDEQALRSGGYPYDDHLDDKIYEDELTAAPDRAGQAAAYASSPEGLRLVLLFEGRDAAGKGGADLRPSTNISTRAPRGSWPCPNRPRSSAAMVFPALRRAAADSGEIVALRPLLVQPRRRRAGDGLLRREAASDLPRGGPRLREDAGRRGIVLFKFWLDIGREMQLKRFHERRHNPLKIWKLSPIDYAAMAKWDDYTAARDEMFAATHTSRDAVDHRARQRQAPGAPCHHPPCAGSVDYAGKDKAVIGRPDDPLILRGPKLSGRVRPVIGLGDRGFRNHERFLFGPETVDRRSRPQVPRRRARRSMPRRARR